MAALRAILLELWGLFVDDGLFALSILIWLLIGWSMPRLGVPSVLTCALFVAGFVFLLLGNTHRRAHKD